MASKLKRSESRETEVTATQPTTMELPVGISEPDDEIRRRAYEIYLERNEQPGSELDDWLQAEREVSLRAQEG